MSVLGARSSSTLPRAISLHAANRAPAVYVGLDPTASSLHIGNLLQLCALIRFRRRGYRTVVLLGGATALIGDPSGRSSERPLVDDTRVTEANARSIAESVQRIVTHGANDGPPTVLVNNMEWLGQMSALELLRDVGKHFPVHAMLMRDSVRSRLDGGSGMSFTEFSYQLLQAYDFYVLHRNYDVGLQIGGSDQWGNIVAGIDFVRRRVALEGGNVGGDVSGLTLSLLLAADGSKLGKSAGNATMWLNAHLTSPFELYQHFVQLTDADAASLLPRLSLASFEELESILVAHDADRSKRIAQLYLARSVCSLVHGAETMAAVEYATAILFGVDSQPGAKLAASTQLGSVLSALPHSTVSRAELFAKPIVTLLADTQACSSRTTARQLVLGGGCYVGGHRVADVNYVVRTDDLITVSPQVQFCVLRTGKRTYRIVRVVPSLAA